MCTGLAEMRMAAGDASPRGGMSGRKVAELLMEFVRGGTFSVSTASSSVKGKRINPGAGFPRARESTRVRVSGVSGLGNQPGCGSPRASRVVFRVSQEFSTGFEIVSPVAGYIMGESHTAGLVEGFGVRGSLTLSLRCVLTREFD